MNLQRSIGWDGDPPRTRSGQDLAARFTRVRSATERLSTPLSGEDQNLQSMPDASPTKWHRAHTSWFFETFILARAPGYRVFDPSFSYLFNSYYEAVGPRHARPQRGLLSRPSATAIGEFRDHVDKAMLDCLAGDVDEHTAALIELGLNHEEQHQELLLTDILHAFAQNPLKPAYMPAAAAPGPGHAPGHRQFNGGLVWIGHEGEAFAFDNEGPRHQVFLRPFALANQTVTNAEWLEFINAGGYREPRFWLSDGWQQVIANNWEAPLYWEQRECQWFTMTLAGLQPLDVEAPVAHVSYYEAEAFARWRGKRLPTEAEWEHAASSLESQEGNYCESGYLRPLATQAHQMFGSVWEWTSSAYAPYPGYQPAPGAVGEYNGKFMVNQMVLRGGSCVTPRGHVRATYRNFFYPHQRWQFGGLRLAEDVSSRKRHAVVSPFLKEVWEGLSQPQKRLSSKYFYDAKGAALFERICDLPEYYLTRTETKLLRELAPELAPLIEPGTALVEYGCGSCLKTRILLDCLPQLSHYVPLDICGDALAETSATLASEYPLLHVRPMVSDFMQPISLPDDLASKPLLGFFPGSTIGNLTRGEAEQFLVRARSTLGHSGRLLIGIDLVKDPGILLRAYDDEAGVTAAFNKNVLSHINRELDGTFDLSTFEHRAVWNPDAQRIEMHLVSSRDQTVTVGGRPISILASETLQTENCHKYEVEAFADLASACGWSMEKAWISPAPEFAVVLLRSA